VEWILGLWNSAEGRKGGVVGLMGTEANQSEQPFLLPRRAVVSSLSVRCRRGLWADGSKPKRAGLLALLGKSGMFAGFGVTKSEVWHPDYRDAHRKEGTFHAVLSNDGWCGLKKVYGFGVVWFV